MESMRIPAILLFACLGLEAAPAGVSPAPGPTTGGEVGVDIPIRTWEAPRYFQPPAAKASASPMSPDAVSSTPSIFVAVTPCRILDTRGLTPPSPGYGAPALSDQVNREFQVTGSCGIPAGAAAVSANATVVAAGGAGWLALWDGGSGSAWPGNSTMNFTAGAVLANAAIVPLSATGTINARAYIPTSLTTHFLLDVNGYYTSDPMIGPFVQYQNNGQTFASGTATIVNYASVAYVSADGSGLVTTGSNWHFTAPKAGVYEVTATADFFPATISKNSHLVLEVIVNSLASTFLGSRSVSAGFNDYVMADGAANVVLATNDQLTVMVYQTTGQTLTMMPGFPSAITIRFVRPLP